MKLELKHLSAYVPHGLRIQTIDDDNYKVIQSIKHIQFTKVIGQYSIITSDGWELNSDEFKPILRPLSDLKRNYFDKIGKKIDKDGLETWVSLINKGLISYVYAERMIEEHFDIFGLIPSGLAIDINTL